MLDQHDESGKLLQYRGADQSPNCATCPCSRGGRAGTPVQAFGSIGALAVVGEGPGGEEQFQKYPFVGPSGSLLNKVFNRNGIDRVAQWITNALVCSRPASEQDLAKAIECCRPRLEQEMKDIQPRAILALGKTAMLSLRLETTSISDARGTVQYSPVAPGIPVITSIHPAALLRGGAGEMSSSGSQKQNVDAQMLFLEADIVKAHRIASGELAAEWSDDVMVFIEPPQATVLVPGTTQTAPVVVDANAPGQTTTFVFNPPVPLAAVPVSHPTPVAIPTDPDDMPDVHEEPTRPGVPVPGEDDPTKPNIAPAPTPPGQEKAPKPLLPGRMADLLSDLDRVVGQIKEAALMVPGAFAVQQPRDNAAFLADERVRELRRVAWLTNNPDVEPLLRQLHARVGDAGLYVDIVSSVVAEVL